MACPCVTPDSKVPFLQTTLFADAAKDGIMHGFFGRKGGMSKGLYEGLNCGPGSKDNPQDVKANREAVARVLGTQPDHILSLYQIHSADCMKVTKGWGDDRPQADAMVTDVPGLALSILTADCAPVLFCGWAGAKPVIGAAHAGWKGAIGGVLEKTVDKMVKEYGVELDTVRAAIGPTIQKKSYEVSDEFYETFIKQNLENERFFQGARKPGHFMFDLPGFCAFRLHERGVQNVQIVEKDTYADEAGFYSFRRTTHRAEADYGRQISAVMIVDGKQ